MAIATSILAATIGALGVIGGGVATAIGSANAASKQKEAAEIAAASRTSTTSSAPQSRAQLLSGNPNVLNTEPTATLSGRGRLLGN